MANVQVSSVSGGTNPYTLRYNPVYFDPAPGYPVREIPILHGASCWQRSAWDSRIRIFEWRNNKVDEPNFSAQMVKMRTWIGKTMYFNFNNINDLVTNWPVSNTWKKVRIIDIQSSYRDGGALKYDSVRLIVQPEV